MELSQSSLLSMVRSFFSFEPVLRRLLPTVASLFSFAVSDPHQAEEEEVKEEQDIKLEKIQDESKSHEEAEKKEKVKKVSTKSEGALMMKEEREIGAVSWAVYKKYGELFLLALPFVDVLLTSRRFNQSRRWETTSRPQPSSDLSSSLKPPTWAPPSF